LLRSRSVLRSIFAVTTAIALLATGCAAPRPWPAQPIAVSTPFASHGQVATIDILPLDLQMWGERGFEGHLPDLHAAAEVSIMSVALEALARRNYSVGATLDWNGDFAGGSAMSRDDLLATVGSLARYGAAAARHPGELPVPFLPARLGTATGSDATLYVGGWAYVAQPRESTGEQVAKGILIAVLVISVIAIIAVLADGKKSPRGGGGGGPVPNLGRGRSSPGFIASRGAQHVHRTRSLARTIDAFGHAAIHVAAASPDWGKDPALPREGGESQMYLEMTLVDNRTGEALWHARQTFPASAAIAAETARVAQTVLALLPARAAPPAGP
jgi:hypothetical protein